MTDMGSQTIRRRKIIAAMATEPRRIRMTGALLLRRAHVLLLRVSVRTADARHKCQRNNDRREAFDHNHAPSVRPWTRLQRSQWRIVPGKVACSQPAAPARYRPSAQPDDLAIDAAGGGLLNTASERLRMA